METMFQRFFGTNKSAVPPPSVKIETESLFEHIYHEGERLQEIIDAYTRKIAQKGQEARNYARLGLEEIAKQHFAHRLRLEGNLTILTKKHLGLMEIVESLRMLEVEKITIVSMDKAISIMKSYTETVNYENATRVREDLEAKQRELTQIHRLMAKPLRGTPTLNESELEDAWLQFIDQDEVAVDDDAEETVVSVSNAQPRAKTALLS